MGYRLPASNRDKARRNRGRRLEVGIGVCPARCRRGFYEKIVKVGKKVLALIFFVGIVVVAVLALLRLFRKSE